MKCGTCKKTHKGREDMERQHRLKAERERDLYRERAIDEVASHHPNATRQIATLDVDLEVKRHLTGVYLLLALVLLPFLGGCNTLKKDFLGKRDPAPKFDTSPYAQLYASGVAVAGEVTVTETVAFPPASVDVYWSQYRPRSRNGQIEISCDAIGPNSAIDKFDAVQPGRAWPYAVVSVSGLVVTVQFKGMGNDQGCWAFRSNPNIVGSSAELY